MRTANLLLKIEEGIIIDVNISLSSSHSLPSVVVLAADDMLHPVKCGLSAKHFKHFLD